LATLDGFLRRELLRGDDGRWWDVVYWRSREHADASEETIAELPTCAHCISMMDHASISVLRLELEQQSDPKPRSSKLS
jgi:hypothetical protein